MNSRDRVEMHGKMAIAVEMIEKCPEFAALIPEVRSNLVYAAPKTRSINDVIAADGRITVLNGQPRASGRPRFGGSSHMARVIMEFQKKDPAMRAAIDFASSPQIAGFVNDYARERGWTVAPIDRANREPNKLKAREAASVPWKTAEAIRVNKGRVPKLFYDNGAIGKEPVTVMVAGDPIELATDLCEMAREYRRRIAPGPKVGKIGIEEFGGFIQKRLGWTDKRVLVPPRPGVDAGVIELDNGKVMVVAEDPIFPAPGLSLDTFGWFTVHIGASDVAVMGVKPQYMTYSLLLPPGTPESDLRTIVDSIHNACRELQIAIVGGHTGYYPTVTVPIVGGISVFAVADKDAYVTPAGARAGDEVILTKGPAIEATGLLAVLYKDALAAEFSAELVSKAMALQKQITVVRDALTAMEAGGVTAMHDATEGGVRGGLFEICDAGGVGMEIDERKFILPKEVSMVCGHLGIDPLDAIAEGSLLITCKRGRSAGIVRRLAKAGIRASVIGTILKGKRTRTIRRLDGTTQPLYVPPQDPFWPAFFRGLERGQ